jgi:predicted lipoprotein with Yx(FWY)xxD motif
MHRARLIAPIVAVLAIAVVTAFVVASSGGTTKAAASTTAAVALDQTSLGPVLVDGGGRTLYLFEGDRPDVSTLSQAGRAVWPPFTAKSQPAAMGGANSALIATIPGSGQVTYNGHPLYYYVGDQHAGQTAGQGLNQFGARWYVLSATGRAITSTTPANSTSAPSTYGY